MHRCSLVGLFLASLLAAVAGAAPAQQALEIIPLRHRTVEQVLPVLQPLVESGGTLSGSRGQLFVRASPANVAEIKRALDAIDRPARRLQISVRFDDAEDRERRELGGSATVGTAGARVTVTAEEARRASTERVDQRVQVLEGGRAVIFSGQSRPLRVPGSTEIQDIESGFEVTPRLSGERVVLEVAAQRETPGAHPGQVQGSRVATTVTARLGEWVEVGGTASQEARDDRGIGAARTVRAAQSRRTWLKVEELH
jgi:type II secretory pathway component GspD/PulD (secretin)